MTFSGHVGFIFFMQFLNNPGPFCRDCGLHVFRDMTSDMLIKGWWGLISGIVTPILIMSNLARRRWVVRLAAPQRNPAVVGIVPAPLDPGNPVLARFQSLLGIGLVLLLLSAVVVAGFVTSRQSRVGGCVYDTQFVSCDRKHDGRIVKIVTDRDDCPPEATGYLKERYGKYYCLVDE